jgi:single-strand DNA-binding protein
MNTTTFTGRLTADPEVRFAATGTPVATLRVANNDRDEHPVFVTVTAFATLAQVVADHLTKGRKVGVTGRLYLDEWQTDGQKRSRLTVIANQIDFLDAPPTTAHVHAGITALVTANGAEEPF